VALFGQKEGRRVLIGEGQVDDHTIGEKVELRVGEAPGIRARQIVNYSAAGNEQQLSVTNDAPEPRTVEVELPLEARGAKLVKRDGWMLWRVRVPANGSAELRYRLSR
jgi:hypothetical protein